MAFALDKPRGKMAGVCAGLARRFDLDVTWIRVAFVALTLFGFGTAAFAYLVIALVAPKA